jgi:hypothetical protein
VIDITPFPEPVATSKPGRADYDTDPAPDTLLRDPSFQDDTEPTNIWDYRVAEDYDELFGAEELEDIPVLAPEQAPWFCAHPEFRAVLAAVEDGTGPPGPGGLYIVYRSLWGPLNDTLPRFGPWLLVFCQTLAAQNFLLRVWLPPNHYPTDDRTRAELRLAELARHTWVRLRHDPETGRCWTERLTGFSPEPVWNDLLFEEVVHAAFRERTVTSLDHPVLKRLLQEP